MTRRPFALLGAAIALLIGVGAIATLAYDAGVSAGSASGAAAAAPVAYWAWAGPHFWGFGIFFPILFLLFFFFVVRALFFGSGGPRHGSYSRYGTAPRRRDDAFDEWHRRAHERAAEEHFRSPAEPGSK